MRWTLGGSTVGVLLELGQGLLGRVHLWVVLVNKGRLASTLASERAFHLASLEKERGRWQ